MRGTSLVLGLAATLALAACATPRADECHVEIEGPEELRVESGDVRASYRVQGRSRPWSSCGSRGGSQSTWPSSRSLAGAASTA
jgi:hypothetical protein